MEKYVQKRFGAIAVEKGFITEDQLVEALKTQATENVIEGKHRRLGEILQEKGLLKPRDLIGAWVAAFLSDKGREITGEVGTLSDYRERHGIPISS